MSMEKPVNDGMNADSVQSIGQEEMEIQVLRLLDSMVAAIESKEQQVNKSTASESCNNGRDSRRKVAYVFSDHLLKHCNRLPKVKGRALLVHQLISAYDLVKDMIVVKCQPATEAELRSFHSEQYINCIKTIGDEVVDDTNDVVNEEFGIGYDCPALSQLYDLVSTLGGSSLTAAKAIASKMCDIALNWSGGWHHCHNDEAAGYCYVNDIVLSILHLLDNGFTRILYLDIDLHHGDAVENAFKHTNKVMTVSFHKYECGFFPGTGSINDQGLGQKAKYYCINVPLRDGMNDRNFVSLTRTIIGKVMANYRPQVIICQCGADTLVGDPMNSFNLTLKGPGECVRFLAEYKLPMILLGGGGYNSVNTARLWTYLTSIVLETELINDIPDHSLFLAYRPSYELHLEAGYRPDNNDALYLDNVMSNIINNLDFVS